MKKLALVVLMLIALSITTGCKHEHAPEEYQSIGLTLLESISYEAKAGKEVHLKALDGGCGYTGTLVNNFKDSSAYNKFSIPQGRLEIILSKQICPGDDRMTMVKDLYVIKITHNHEKTGIPANQFVVARRIPYK